VLGLGNGNNDIGFFLLEQESVVPKGMQMNRDRLGNVMYSATTVYYPYGEEYTVTANDKDKFGTYHRDSTTGLDYAVNRYYSTQPARFLTADPARQGLNHYSYVAGDPINSVDPTGLATITLPQNGTICPTALPTCISTGFASGSQVTSGDIHNSSGLAIGMEQPNQGGGIASGDLSPALSQAHDTYVATTVVPAFLRAAFDAYPTVIEAVLPTNAVSATIIYIYGERDGLLTAVSPALTLLPHMAWEGWASMLLNDNPTGALQVAASLAYVSPAVAAYRALAPGVVSHGGLFAQPTPVIGGLIYTTPYMGVEGYEVLSAANWTWHGVNVPWMQAQMAVGRGFLVHAGGRWTGLEIEMLMRAGWERVGTFIVPPVP
jgi:RHS repeat-associated protein